MEQICGYKGLDGHFYEKENECKKADLKFKIKNIKKELDRFEMKLSNSLYEYDRHCTSHTQIRTLEIVAKAVLRDSDIFLNLIQEKENLKELLDSMVKEEIYLDKWWVKIKWW